MITCLIKRSSNDKYGWDGTEPACDCIMAKILGGSIGMNELINMIKNNMISKNEYDSIRAFDNNVGRETDMINIQNISHRWNVDLMVNKK